MITWISFQEREPQMARQARELFYQFGVGLAYLATVRPDGGPRLHPMCPIINDEGMFARIVPSPKRKDLKRDGRFALHSFPRDDDEDSLYITGVARPVTEEAVARRIAEQFFAERPMIPPAELGDDQPFEFQVEMVMLTKTIGHGDPNPKHTVWKGTAA